jgi:hypothetical protein
VKPLQMFLRRHGFELVHVQRTPSKGGSIRCFAQLAGGPRKELPSVKRMLQLEEDFGLYRLETYRDYEAKIERAKFEVLRVVAGLRAKGHTIAGYGASATATVLIYHFGLGDALEFIVDDNPLRQNRFSPGHHIAVVSSDALYRDKPDAVIVLVWRFADMIIARNEEYLRRGGQFIVPLPSLRIERR